MFGAAPRKISMRSEVSSCVVRDVSEMCFSKISSCFLAGK